MGQGGRTGASRTKPSGQSDPPPAGRGQHTAPMLVLKRGAERRVLAGHPWIYRGEVADLRGPWTPGGPVDVVDASRRPLGRGFYNPRPSLVCRLLTRRDEPLDAGLFGRRLADALAFRRTAGLVTDAYRLCWGEADGLPGLIVDRYTTVSVLQCLTAGMASHVTWAAQALDELFPGAPIFRTDDATGARLEGFEPEHGWIRPPVEATPGDTPPGACPVHSESVIFGREDPATPVDLLVEEDSCRFMVRLGQGHKTGFYLDQRENRAVVSGHASGRRMLDAFCYTAAFACHALRRGAARAVLVDSSTEALALARRNLDLNGVADRAEIREGNAFDLLRELGSKGERFGLVVLDPPPFTRRKDTLEAAARGYKEINLRAIRLLEAGGVLATFSCSHHVTPALFEDICREAAGDAGAVLRVLRVLGQCGDHPVLVNVPETRYLTGLLLELVTRRPS
jgi:23S rRNA (cytosine1962-C5)-methyltransferase